MTTPMHRVLPALAALAVAGALQGCQPDAPPQSGPAARDAAQPAYTPPVAVPDRNATPEDTALARRIESALAAETALHGSRIGVIADDGVVTLTGSTRSPDLRSMAAQIALSVNGVRLVRNELAIALTT